MTSPRRVRVLVVDDARTNWGAQAFLLRLVDRLAAHGVDLVLGAPGGTDLATSWQERGLPLEIIDLPLDRSVRVAGTHGRLSAVALAKESGRFITGARRIARAARSSSADVIWANAHSVHLESALAGRGARVPALVQLHEGSPYLFGRLVRTAAVMASSKTVAVSGGICTGLPQRVTRGIDIVPNGIDVSQFRPTPADPGVRASLGASSEDVLIVVLARLDPVKRIEDLVRAAAGLPSELPWKIAFVGTTSVYPDYAARAAALARDLLGDRVVLAGRREDTVAVLNAADVLAHAGEIEGTPLVLLEAQACETPIVAYAMGGVPESVVAGESGLLARPLHVEDLTANLARLIDDAELRRTMGKAGRAYVEQNHRLEVQAERTASVLRAVARQ